MAHKITRFEAFPTEVFVNIEITDDLGFYNYGRWLSPEDAELLKKEMSDKKFTEKQDLEAKTATKLTAWAASKLTDARSCIEADKRCIIEEKEILEGKI